MIQKLADLPHKPTLMPMLMLMLMFVLMLMLMLMFVLVLVLVLVLMLSFLVVFSVPLLSLHVSVMPLLHVLLPVHVIVMEPGPTVTKPGPASRDLTHHSCSA